MTTLRNRLQAVGKLHRWTPQLEKLATLIMVNTVMFVFVDAELRENVFFFETQEKYQSALNFRQAVEKVYPHVILACLEQQTSWDQKQRTGGEGYLIDRISPANEEKRRLRVV